MISLDDDIILPQMSGYIKYFDDGEKKCVLKLKMMTFLKYKIFNGVIDKFSDNKIPKERNHYTCIAAICIDSGLKIDKKS